jgi:hypothetical protein
VSGTAVIRIAVVGYNSGETNTLRGGEMANAKKKPGVKKGKKPGKREVDVTGPAKVWIDRWTIDPITGKKFRLILHKLPGKGKIDPKLIEAAIVKVRDERLAREKAERDQAAKPE